MARAFADAGMRIDDLEDWKLEIGAKTISLSGNLTTSGLRRALVVIESPTTSDSTADEVKSQSAEKTLSAEAKASQDHYRTVVGMFDDLKKDMGSVANLASTQTYFDKYAKRIERLPILNVDPELLNYSAFVAKSLRAAAGAVRTMGIQSGVRQAEIISSDAGTSFGSSPCSCANAGTSSGSSVTSATRYGRRSPTTTHCDTQRDCFTSFSRFAGVMFFPPAVMMMSFFRPVMYR